MDDEEFDARQERDDSLYTEIRRYAVGEGCPPKVAHQIALRVSQMLIAVVSATTGQE